MSREINSSWISSAIGDFDWYCNAIPQFGEFKGEPFSAWCSHLRRHPNASLKTVIAFCKARVNGLCIPWSPSVVYTIDDRDFTWRCRKCEYESTCKQSMILHAIKSHGAIDPIRRYVFDDTCIICLTQYGNKMKVANHLRQPHSICLRNSRMLHRPLDNVDIANQREENVDITRSNKSSGWSLCHSSFVCSQALGPALKLSSHGQDPRSNKPVIRLALRGAPVVHDILPPLDFLFNVATHSRSDFDDEDTFLTDLVLV